MPAPSQFAATLLRKRTVTIVAAVAAGLAAVGTGTASAATHSGAAAASVRPAAHGSRAEQAPLAQPHTTNKNHGLPRNHVPGQPALSEGHVARG